MKTDLSAGETQAATTSESPIQMPRSDLRVVLQAALKERWGTLSRQTKRARSKPSEKTIHDLRVSIRRMLALIDMAKLILPPDGGDVIRKRLKAQLASLSALRDTQVQILRAEEYLPDYPVISGFLKQLRTRELAESKSARKDISRMDRESMKDYFRKLLTKLDDFLSPPVMRDAAHSILWGSLARIFAESVVLRTHIRDDEENRIAKIHELRLLFKRFRYTVEVLLPLFPDDPEDILGRMSRYQAMMGKIQDTEIFADNIRIYEKRLRKKERKTNSSMHNQLNSLHVHLLDDLKKEADEFCVAMEELDEFWDHVK